MSSQFSIDNISLEIFGKNKVFFECGGAHPSEGSNTIFLESNGWNGLVVEPWDGYNSLYQNLRKNTILENYALVSKDYKEQYIYGNFSSDFGGSVIEGAHGNPWTPQKFPATTIYNLLKKHNLKEIHTMTIDVEGYEVDVLNGIDFEWASIHFLVVEHHWNIIPQNDNDHPFYFLEKSNYERIGVIGNQHLFFNKSSNFYTTAKDVIGRYTNSN